MTHKPPQRLLDELDGQRLQYTLLPHRRTTTAAAEARALEVDPGEVAKTVVLTTPSGFVRAVVPASRRLDLRKVRRLLETKEVALASEEELTGAYPEYELGAVPPLVGGGGDQVVVDLRLSEHESVVVEAGTHEASLRLKTSDLVAQPSASVGDLCLE
jgi:Ala-tRNA(Pro) deacylase